MSRYITLRRHSNSSANVKVIASGPWLAAVETEVKYGKSTIKVTVSIRRSTAYPRWLSADSIL